MRKQGHSIHWVSCLVVWCCGKSLQWRHNERDGVSNHQPHDCLFNRYSRRRSKNTSKLCVTGLHEGNSPLTGEFPAQMASNAEIVSIWWRHHVVFLICEKYWNEHDGTYVQYDVMTRVILSMTLFSTEMLYFVIMYIHSFLRLVLLCFKGLLLIVKTVEFCPLIYYNTHVLAIPAISLHRVY